MSSLKDFETKRERFLRRILVSVTFIYFIIEIIKSNV
jgi:hypothetical protein